MSDPTSRYVDAYINDKLLGDDPILAAVLANNAAAGLPPIDVAPNQGKLLYLLAKLAGARRILEIGTLGGYSSIWLARALPPGGRLVTLEADPHHAEVARRNFAEARLEAVIELREGPALDTLPLLADEQPPEFDLVFIDADKPSNPDYVDWALRLSRSGALIIVDNVVRGGQVADPGSTDLAVLGTRRLFDILASEGRIDATAIQTVGLKGHDGFLLGIVR